MLVRLPKSCLGAVVAFAIAACGFQPSQMIDGGGGGSDASDAMVGSDASTTLPRSCKELHSTSGVPSGSYVIDPDGPGGEDKIPVTCDMETDGGGWTIVFYPPSPNVLAIPLAYTVPSPRLLMDATAALITFRDTAQETSGNYATFALPAEWRTDSPFNYPGNDLTITASVNSAAPTSTTLKFGNGSFGSVRCDGGWTGGAYGKVCIAQTAAPFFSGFAAASQDYCTYSLSDWNSAACTSDLRFSIAVR